MKKKLLLSTLVATFILSLSMAICFLPTMQVTAEDSVEEPTTDAVVTYDTAVVYDLFELTGEKEFTSAKPNGTANRNIGQMPDTHNVAFRAKLSYANAGNSNLIINFLMGHKNSINSDSSYYFLNEYGYLFHVQDGKARLAYQGDGTETNQFNNTAITLEWADLRSKLEEIDNLDGTGKINTTNWIHGAEAYIFEMGYVKAYTDGEWTGNKVYVKINDVEIMSFTDTSTTYKEKGTYFGKGATGYDWTYYTFSSLASIENAKVYDLFDTKGVTEHSPTTENDATQQLGKFDSNMNVAFRAKVNYPAAEEKNHNLFLNQLILQPSSGSHFAYGGYGYQFLLKDREMSICYDTDPSTSNDENEIVAGVSMFEAELNEILPSIVGVDSLDDMYKFYQGKIEFTFEFGCEKYFVSNQWVGNYLYVKINDVEIMHFIDKGANFEYAKTNGLGQYVNRGAYGRQHSPFKYLTAYTVDDMISGKFEMTSGAQIKGTGSGLRFEMSTTEAAYQRLVKFVGEDNVANISYGMLIVPEDYVEANALTVENLFGENAVYYLMTQNENGDWNEYDGNKIPLFNLTGNSLTDYAFRGSIVNLKEYNITRNFVGLGYIKYTDEGVDSYYLANYADNKIENNTRSMYQVAKAAYEDGKTSDTMKSALKTNYLDKVAEVTVNYIGVDGDTETTLKTETIYGVIGQTTFGKVYAFDGYTFIANNNDNATFITVAKSGNIINYYFQTNSNEGVE